MFEKKEPEIFKALVHVESGVIVDFDGETIAHEIGECSYYAEDVGLGLPDGKDDFPYMVFEGYYSGGTYWTDCGYEYDYEPIGKYRKPTPEEWYCMYKTGYCWPSSELLPEKDRECLTFQSQISRLNESLIQSAQEQQS